MCLVSWMKWEEAAGSVKISLLFDLLCHCDTWRILVFCENVDIIGKDLVIYEWPGEHSMKDEKGGKGCLFARWRLEG